LLNLAYAAIAARHDTAARTYLLEADVASPGDPTPRKELFYVDQRLGRFDEAFGQAHKASLLGDHDATFELDVAYALLDAHRNAEADTLFRSLVSAASAKVSADARAQLAADEAVMADAMPTPAATPAPDDSPTPAEPAPGDVDLENGYDAAARGDHAGALRSFDAYLARVPGDDRARLQRAYEMLALDQQAEADAQLSALEHSADADVARSAHVQLVADRQINPANTGDVYAYYQREGRFSGNLYGGDLLVPLAPARFQPYVAVHAADDTGSGVGSLRQTLTDRVLSVDGGLRLAAGSNGWFYAEAGRGFGLSGQADIADARYGYTMFREWQDPFGARPHTAVDADVSVYSRYAGNAIGYAQIMHDFPLAKSVRGVVEFNLAADDHRLWYNNTFEGAAGIQIGGPNVAVRLMTVRGLYLPRGADRPAQAAYGTARVQLLFGVSI
jgi:hypothetical protein